MILASALQGKSEIPIPQPSFNTQFPSGLMAMAQKSAPVVEPRLLNNSELGDILGRLSGQAPPANVLPQVNEHSASSRSGSAF